MLVSMGCITDKIREIKEKHNIHKCGHRLIVVFRANTTMTQFKQEIESYLEPFKILGYLPHSLYKICCMNNTNTVYVFWWFIQPIINYFPYACYNPMQRLY